MAVVSPCIGICAIDSLSGWCRGCFRSLEEIAGWMRMSDAERRAVLAALPGRRRTAPPPPPVSGAAN